MTDRVTVADPQPKNPTLQESYDQLKEQGLIQDEQPPVEDQGEPERPEWLPEKFKSPDELAKAYAELEKKLGQSKEDPEGASEEPKEDLAQKAVEDAGLDWGTLSDEYADNGDLTEESYAALEAKGINREMVQEYIAGQQARVQMYETTVMNLAGGEEAYKELVAWASKNLSADEIETYDTAVNSFNAKQARFAVEGLKARMIANHGQAPQTTVDGRNAPEAGYEYVEQMLNDINDPRYQKDPAFRAAVARKARTLDMGAQRR